MSVHGAHATNRKCSELVGFSVQFIAKLSKKKKESSERKREKRGKTRKTERRDKCVKTTLYTWEQRKMKRSRKIHTHTLLALLGECADFGHEF